MKKITLFAGIILLSATAFGQTYKLTDMADQTFSEGGDAQWSFEKYAYATGVYSKFQLFGDSSCCNFLDVYNPERCEGKRITEIDNVTPNGNNTWASNTRKAWYDYKFEKTDADNLEKFIYMSRDFETYANPKYAGVISFTIPETGYYTVSGTVIREDCAAYSALYLVPRYRFDGTSTVDSAMTMGLMFPYGTDGGELNDGNTSAQWLLSGGGVQRYLPQKPMSFTMAFYGKKGDVISFEANASFNYGTQAYARSCWARTFFRALSVEKTDETTAKSMQNYVEPYGKDKVQKLMDLLDAYQSKANDYVGGSNYGEYSSDALSSFFKKCEEIGKANDAGLLNNMNCVLYIAQLEKAWSVLQASKVVTDFIAEGNYRLFHYDLSTSSVVYDANVMAANDNNPWGFDYYSVSAGTYTAFPNHNTNSKFGSSASAWYKGAGDWLYLSDNGALHPMPAISPAIVFTAPKDGVYKADISLYRPNPNLKVENPLYLRCRYMDAATTTCLSKNFIFAKQYGSVANDGQKGKAPIQLTYFVNLKKGDKITFEEDCYTANSNSSAGTQITDLSVCSCASADSVYTVAIAKASGLDFYNPYVTGNPSALKAIVAKADSLLSANKNNIGTDGGNYPEDQYSSLQDLVNEAQKYIAMEGDESATQSMYDKLALEINDAITAFIDAKVPFEITITGDYAFMLNGTDKRLTQNNTDAGVFYYAGFFNAADAAKDAARFSGVSVDQYNWIFNFSQVDGIQGTVVTNENGYLTLDGYVVAGENADPAANTFRFFTAEKDSKVFAVRRNDGLYWGNVMNWVSPYNKISTSSVPQYIFVLDTQTITGIQSISSNSGFAYISSVRYFTIDGREVNNPRHGIFVKRTTWMNGQTKVTKVVLK
jgi:hypothetical protein